MKRPYALQPLRSLKEREKDERARNLAEAEARLRDAERLAAGAASNRADQELRLAAELGEEGRRLQSGLARAGDLASAEQWRAQAERRIEGCRAAEARATEEVRAARDTAEHAREALAGARAVERAVEAHRERWLCDERQMAERREEESAEEAWRSRPTQKGRPS